MNYFRHTHCIERMLPEPDYSLFTPDWLINMQNKLIQTYDKQNILSEYEALISNISVQS